MLKSELEVLKSEFNNLKNNDEEIRALTEILMDLTEKLSEIEPTVDTSELESNITSLIEKTNSLKEQLGNIGNEAPQSNKSLVDDVKDELELVLEGMNNINHYVNDAINENGRSYDDLDERLGTIEKQNKIGIWLSVILLIVLLIQFLLFFDI